ncbi:MAG: WD40 repeat domain-containing protein [Anaerolineae bacterium]|jgi:WD40 repeat protein|nr:WD40 repeat domain-containing protein [Anaerolineae bacterium]
MRFWLLVFILAPLLSTVYAQEEGTAVMHRLNIPIPEGYNYNQYKYNWSPNSAYVAFLFSPIGEGPLSPNSQWEVFEISSGTSVGTFHDFMEWYEDSTRFLARLDPSAPPTIFDVQTGQPVAALDDWWPDYLMEPISSSISNLDQTGTLRVYDTETGAVGLMMTGMSELPHYAPDRSRFAINVPDDGLHIYDAETFDLLYRLEGYTSRPFLRHEMVWRPDGRQLLVTQQTDPYDYYRKYLGPHFIWTLEEDTLSQPFYNVTADPVWSADGQRVAVTSDFTKVRVYDTQTGALLETVRGYPDGSVRLIAWEGHHLIASIGDFYTGYVLSVWDMEQNIFTITRYGDYPSYIVKPTTISIAEFGPGVTEISLSTGEVLPRLVPDEVLYISPDHRWGAGYSHLFEAEPSVPPTLMFSRFSPPATIAMLDVDTGLNMEGWSPDSRYFVVSSATEIIIWELVQGGAG